jgi:hypothetical protein
MAAADGDLSPGRCYDSVHSENVPPTNEDANKTFRKVKLIRRQAFQIHSDLFGVETIGI